MPEINECKQMATSLNQNFSGKKLKSIIWFSKPGKKTKNCAYDTYSLLEKRLPLKLEKVWSRGKKIVLELEGEIYLISSPLLHGSWVFQTSTHQKIQLNFEEEKEIAVFNDVRGFGLLNLYFNKTDFEAKMKEIGPDYYDPIVTLDFYMSVIKNKRIQNKEICDFLMDQKRISGLGAYLVSDIMYASKILPTRKLKDITEQEIKDLYDNTILIVKESAEGEGLTIKDYLTATGEAGTYVTKVYGRKVDDLGHQVLTGTFSNKRTSHYVIEVQK